MPRPTPKINFPERQLLAALTIVLAPFAEQVATILADRLRAGTDPDWFDQHRSPEGNRRHCAIVRRRIAEGRPGAAIVGRRHLLSREALEEELALAHKTKKPKLDPDADVRDLAGELGLRLVANGRGRGGL